MSTELDEIKMETAGIAIRLDNVEGYFNNFDTTLNNHMTDYAKRQEDMRKEIKSLWSKFTWGFWIIFSLLLIVIGGITTGAVMLLQYLLRMIGG